MVAAFNDRREHDGPFSNVRNVLPRLRHEREKYIDGAGVQMVALLFNEAAIVKWQQEVPRGVIGA